MSGSLGSSMPAGAGIIGYATYVPHWRLSASRPVASFDEDSTTMAVAAASELLSGPGARDAVHELWFATSTPAYLDKTNATAVHAALGLGEQAPASDAIGTARSAMAALRSALREGGLVTAADVRVGRPRSADEKRGADAAAAVLCGAGSAQRPVLAEVLATASVTEEFLDRWRAPSAAVGQQWEERFGLDRYGPLVLAAARRAVDAAGQQAPDRVIVASSNPAVTKAAGKLVREYGTAEASGIGFAGAADPLLALARALDDAEPGQTVLVLSATDGCDALLLRATGALPAHRQRTPLAEQAGGGRIVDYPTYLSWRGLLEMEPPRRPEPGRPAGPPSARGAQWKFGLIGSRCTACGFAHMPPARVCRRCGATDAMEPLAGAGARGTVATFTVDRLAYSPSPPVVQAVVDFGTGEGDGRGTFEVADADPAVVSVGTAVELVFRCLFTAGDVRNYFWKARVRSAPAAGDRGESQ